MGEFRKYIREIGAFIQFLKNRTCDDCPMKEIYEQYKNTLKLGEKEKGCICHIFDKIIKLAEKPAVYCCFCKSSLEAYEGSDGKLLVDLCETCKFEIEENATKENKLGEWFI